MSSKQGFDLFAEGHSGDGGRHDSIHPSQWIQSIQGTVRYDAIIGTNGSGKSTLLNAVAGSFIPDRGHICIGDDKITHWSEFRRAALIGRVFQNPFAGTAAQMTIAENISLAMRRGLSRGLGKALTRSSREEIGERVRSLGMGLENRLDNPIGTLPQRIIMMHKGQVLADYSGRERARIKQEDLLAAFDRIRRREQLDEAVTELLAQQFV